MRIAVVHSFYSAKTPSGENTVVRMQVDALRRAGHEVAIVAVHTDDLSTSGNYALRAAWNVASGNGVSPVEELQKFAPDVVHVHNLFPNYSSKWLAEWRGPIVATVHNYRPVCAAGTLFRDGQTCTECPEGTQLPAIVHGCYRNSRLASIPLVIKNAGGVNKDPLLARCNAVVFLSERSRKQYADFGFKAPAVFTVPNFVETSSRESLQSDGRWVFVGRLSDEKGILPLLNSWPSGAGLDVYGDGPLASEVAKLAKNQVTWHGSVSREEVLGLLPGKHGLVIPSVCAEQFPTVYAEALAAGLPVVAKTGNSAADDVASNAVGGVFHEWSELPSVLRRVESDRDTFSRNASRHFYASFTERQWVASITDIYTSISAGVQR
ncbi:glycosyltransferase family 4 protein [Arthrobacter sp. S13_S34]|nr:glycosyltransferase family 4 protein [Arthrobacter sp. S13_S34]